MHVLAHVHLFQNAKIAVTSEAERQGGFESSELGMAQTLGKLPFKKTDFAEVVGDGQPCAELEEARAALERESAARRRLEEAVAGLEGARDGLALELDEARAAQARLQAEVAALEAATAGLQAEREQLKLFGRRARAELKQLKEANEALRTERDALLAAGPVAAAAGGGGGGEAVGAQQAV